MNAPRLRIDLAKIQHNARVLVQRLGACGIQVTGVTKASLGDAAIAQAMRLGGVRSLGDSRLRNIKALGMAADGRRTVDGSDRNSGPPLPLWLLRSPMLSESAATVNLASMSSNTELDVLDALSTAAVRQRLTHKAVLMVELGDLREGILPGRLHAFIERMLTFPGLQFEGIGTNLACLSGVIPDARNMAELASIASAIERAFAMRLSIVSGGNSANLNWASGLNVSNVGRPGHINNLRLGEAILLGREAAARAGPAYGRVLSCGRGDRIEAEAPPATGQHRAGGQWSPTRAARTNRTARSLASNARQAGLRGRGNTLSIHSGDWRSGC